MYNNDLIDKETKDKMELGTYMHYLLEVFDFKNPDYSFVDDKYKKYLEMFINSGIDFNGKIYKEYEFIYEENNTTSHGIIDLMIEYDNHIDLIDYKTKNIYLSVCDETISRAQNLLKRYNIENVKNLISPSFVIE